MTYTFSSDNTRRKKKAIVFFFLALVIGLGIGFWQKHDTHMVQSSTSISYPAVYRNQQSNARAQAEQWRSSRPEDAKVMESLSELPSSKWFDETATFQQIDKYVSDADMVHQVPIMVIYSIPHRDCGAYSSGGFATAAEYKRYIDTFAKAIGSRQSVIILEPDSLGHMIHKNGNADCLNDAEVSERLTLLSYAAKKLSRTSATKVYLDAGNSGWIQDIDLLAELLQRAGVKDAEGFAVNVSNFYTTKESIGYGQEISSKIGSKHFVIDTSRNGSGAYNNPVNPAYNWCNPPGRSIGEYPTFNTRQQNVDAYLHIKIIGESDGSDPDPTKCFNGPKAGAWWPDYALDIAKRSPGNAFSE